MRPLATLCLATGLAAGTTFMSATVAAEQAASERTAASRLEQRVRRLENVLDSGQLVRLMREIDSLTNEIRELRGAVETQSHRLKELQERQRRLYGDLDRRLRELEVAGRQREQQQQQQQQQGDGSGGQDTPDTAEQISEAVSGAARAEAETAQSEEGSGATASGASAAEQRDAYNAAFDLLKEGRYEAAGQAFSDFLGKYPKGPYSDNAQYWLGEARYVRRDFEGALEAFRRTVQRYSDSTKVPDARLKIGYTLHELERYDEARQVLKQVIAEHSDNTVSRLAEERLLRLERQQANR